MNRAGPFTPGDLVELGLLLDRADRVVPLRDVFDGDHDPRAVAVRHDVDDNLGSIDTALLMAEWEHDHGWRSTYFLLHDSYYWPQVKEAARILVGYGHEVGLHNNAIAESIRQNRDPHAILTDALHELRCAVPVFGTVAHGDPLCRDNTGRVTFVNDEMFLECDRGRARPDARSLWDYGLKYDANWLGRGDYLSDSGNTWSQDFWRTVDAWPARGQLHMLVHPDWWSGAFVREAVAV